MTRLKRTMPRASLKTTTWERSSTPMPMKTIDSVPMWPWPDDDIDDDIEPIKKPGLWPGLFVGVYQSICFIQSQVGIKNRVHLKSRTRCSLSLIERLRNGDDLRGHYLCRCNHGSHDCRRLSLELCDEALEVRYNFIAMGVSPHSSTDEAHAQQHTNDPDKGMCQGDEEGDDKVGDKENQDANHDGSDAATSEASLRRCRSWVPKMMPTTRATIPATRAIYPNC